MSGAGTSETAVIRVSDWSVVGFPARLYSPTTMVPAGRPVIKHSSAPLPSGGGCWQKDELRPIVPVKSVRWAASGPVQI
jgi:hypothetical protein